MKLIDILRIALRMLKINWLRSLLTIVGIAVATLSIVVLVGFGYGMQYVTIGSILKSKSLFSLEVSTLAESGATPLTKEAIEEFRKIPGVVEVSPVYVAEAQIIFNEKLVSTTVRVGSRSLPALDGMNINFGSTFEEDKFQIVLALETLNMLETDVKHILGKQITLKLTDPSTPSNIIQINKPLTVVGVGTGGDAPVNYIPEIVIKDLNKFQITSAKVNAKDRDSVIAAETAIRMKGFQVETLIKTLDEARNVFRWVTIGLFFIASIALVVASIGMFNTLTITLLERTREIGIMKIVGVTDRTVRWLFLIEASLLGFLGGLSGVISGYFFSFLIEFLINKIATKFQGIPVDLFQFPTFFLPFMVVFPTLLGCLTGLYPSVRAARLNPLDAIRYE